MAKEISWSSFAGEFLKEHSQELLLCLAVLLIVVSSTVGAHLLLGDLLWSPVGKCTLAMVATLAASTPSHTLNRARPAPDGILDQRTANCQSEPSVV